ncbi:hypothetical protein C8R45DRAFT_936378 [Mycena sanguinolenta]|nr:hypothetical protein C8R45DRAFT_936378 [Mycena sanguinolenta]
MEMEVTTSSGCPLNPDSLQWFTPSSWIRGGNEGSSPGSSRGLHEGQRHAQLVCHVGPKDSSAWSIVERYENEESMKIHFENPYSKKFMTDVGPLTEAAQERQILTLVHLDLICYASETCCGSVLFQVDLRRCRNYDASPLQHDELNTQRPTDASARYPTQVGPSPSYGRSNSTSVLQAASTSFSALLNLHLPPLRQTHATNLQVRRTRDSSFCGWLEVWSHSFLIVSGATGLTVLMKGSKKTAKNDSEASSSASLPRAMQGVFLRGGSPQDKTTESSKIQRTTGLEVQTEIFSKERGSSISGRRRKSMPVYKSNTRIPHPKGHAAHIGWVWRWCTGRNCETTMETRNEIENKILAAD